MSRSGYSDDYGDEFPNQAEFYRQAVHRATTGYYGQAFLKKLRDALDAMPIKRLITDELKNDVGEVCALGALDPNAKGYEADDLATHFGIARSLAAEIVYMNDEYESRRETPEDRWTRMRAWVDSQIALSPRAEPLDK